MRGKICLLVVKLHITKNITTGELNGKTVFNIGIPFKYYTASKVHFNVYKV